MSGSQSVTTTQVRTELRQAVANAGGARAFARKHGFKSHAGLSLMINGDRPISEAAANACGYIAEMTFRRIVNA